MAGYEGGQAVDTVSVRKESGPRAAFLKIFNALCLRLIVLLLALWSVQLIGGDNLDIIIRIPGLCARKRLLGLRHGALLAPLLSARAACGGLHRNDGDDRGDVNVRIGFRASFSRGRGSSSIFRVVLGLCFGHVGRFAISAARKERETRQD